MRTILDWLGRLGFALLCLLLCFGAVLMIADGTVWNVVWGLLGFALFGFGAFTLFMSLRLERPPTIAAPSPLPAEKREISWFEHLGPDDEEPHGSPFTPAQFGVLEQLRERAQSLPSDGVYSDADHGDDAIVGTVWVAERTGRLLFRAAVRLSPGRMHGARYHRVDGPDMPPPRGGKDSVDVTGGDDELVERTVGWLDMMLRRPVERLEWWYLGRPYAARYQFADTRDALIEAFARDRAPLGRYRRLLAAGHVRPGGGDAVIRVDTSMLGKPHAVIAVRADGRGLPSPPLPKLDWYARV